MLNALQTTIVGDCKPAMKLKQNVRSAYDAHRPPLHAFAAAARAAAGTDGRTDGHRTV